MKIPHNNIVPGPVLNPEHQAMVERFHGELCKLCRIHKSTPDRVVLIYNEKVEAPSGGGESSDTDLLKTRSSLQPRVLRF